ncbi:SCO family protein [Salinisphaera aquimarina]|uniref:SCO family protein n=1 Tax=Salinisphaera aquimarina TaxID=2094031 RepID=A0ABV7EIX4_9GAMM
MKTQSLARLKMLGVFMIFLGPLALAYLMYYGLSYGGAVRTNDGQLVSPAQPLPDIALSDGDGNSVPSGQILEQKWTILQVAGEGCGDACRKSLDETRQIRALLHRRAARVQRVLIVDGAQPLPDLDAQPDLSVYQGDTAQMSALFDAQQADKPGMVYLVDPLGNWMLYYPPGGDGSALFKDIKHLLKLSHIG